MIKAGGAHMAAGGVVTTMLALRALGMKIGILPRMSGKMVAITFTFGQHQQALTKGNSILFLGPMRARFR